MGFLLFPKRVHCHGKLNSSGRAFHTFGAAVLNERSPSVLCDRARGISKRHTFLDLRLYLLLLSDLMMTSHGAKP